MFGYASSIATTLGSWAIVKELRQWKRKLQVAPYGSERYVNLSVHMDRIPARLSSVMRCCRIQEKGAVL